VHKKNKRIGTIILVVLVVAALLVGGVFLAKRFSGKNVNVYAVSDVSYSYSWMDNSEADGTVSTDKIQSVYVSSTQQVTEIYVEEGQTVHVGDPILAFDTTLSELELERQSIKVEQLKLDIQDAEAQLKEIDTYRVGTASSVSYPTYSTGTSTGSGLGSVSYVPYLRTADGLGTASDPLVYLWDDSCVFNQDFIHTAVQTAMANRAAAQDTMTPSEPETPDEAEPDVTEPAEPDTAETVVAAADEAVAPDTTETASDASDEPAEPAEPVTPDVTEPTVPAEPDESDETDELDDPRVFVVFEVRDSNALQGDILRNWEMVMLLGDDGSWAVNLVAPDYDEEDMSSGSSYDDYYSSYVYDDTVYYTATEIAQMKNECNQKIKDLELELKMAELEYDQLSYELSSGEVVSKIEGVVKTVRDVDEARQESKPVVLISGGGGYYVTSVLGELDLDTVQVGDTVTVMSWENYDQFEGTVVEISPYPDESDQYWFSTEGNQNVSLYPFKVFVDEDADLREGEYVEITFDGGGADESGGLYLTSAFVRQENGKSYVYVVGDDGTLEQRFIKTGRILWGSEYEILDGLNQDDYIAFPYGRNVKDGAKVTYADIDELYSYY
jgi:multidrug efflux pump subunit AcrA (membrane-fusion protein)